MSTQVLPVRGESFKGAFTLANLDSDEVFSQGDVLRAAMFVGRTRRDAVRFGEQSWLELLWRVSSIQLGLELLPLPSGYPRQLRRNDQWKRLDRSERGVLNYLCGNVVAKLVAERRLGAPLVLHQDVYQKYLRSPLGPKNARPDFVGWSPWAQSQAPHYSPWITIEAKGRTRFSPDPNGTARKAAKDQAKALTQVRGQHVALHVACWCTERAGRLHAFYEDPEPVRRGLRLDISDDEFVAHYYAPAREILARGEVVSREGDCVSYAIPGVDLRVGMHQKLEFLIRDGQQTGAVLEMLQSWQTDQPRIEDVPLGPDGIAVIPGEGLQGRFRRANNA